MEGVVLAFVISALVGGVIGAILAKWPARTVSGNTLKGALLGAAMVVVFAVFAFLVIGISVDWFGVEEGMRS